MEKIETYRTSGTCCKQIMYSVNEDNILSSCIFIHGCSGNQQAVSKLVVGMHIDDVIERLKGIPCKGTTSCPDQLARALIAYKERSLHPPKQEEEHHKRHRREKLDKPSGEEESD